MTLDPDQFCEELNQAAVPFRGSLLGELRLKWAWGGGPGRSWEKEQEAQDLRVEWVGVFERLKGGTEGGWEWRRRREDSYSGNQRVWILFWLKWEAIGGFQAESDVVVIEFCFRNIPLAIGCLGCMWWGWGKEATEAGRPLE